MTYKEAYMKCNSLAELEKAVNHDVFVAQMLGSKDRMKVIKETAEEVANLKFKEDSEV